MNDSIHVSNAQKYNDPNAEHRAMMLLEALSFYKQHYGAIFPMSRYYRINEKEQHLYPPHLHGYKLHSVAFSVLTHGSWLKDPYRQEFIKIGLVPPEHKVSMLLLFTPLICLVQ
jgi:hypothetical protein